CAASAARRIRETYRRSPATPSEWPPNLESPAFPSASSSAWFLSLRAASIAPAKITPRHEERAAGGTLPHGGAAASRTAAPTQAQRGKSRVSHADELHRPR